MEDNQPDMFFAFACFLTGRRDQEHQDVDGACLTQELFRDADCHKTLLPLDFFLTRNKGKKMPDSDMKKTSDAGRN